MNEGPFIFTARPLRVLGVDENGYGPRAGPLIVTGVVMRYVGEDPEEDLRLSDGWNLGIQDSKRVFRRSVASYARGEALVLSLFDPFPRTPAALLQQVYHISPESPAFPRPYRPTFSLPVWATEIRDLRKALQRRGIVVERIGGHILWPEELRNTPNKLKANLRAFLDLAETYAPDWALFGKMGSMRHYLPYLPGPWEILEEGRDARYRAHDGRRWGFYVGADHRFLPVALASMVGKYVREILMLAVNRNLGFQDVIPHASGYHHDPRTAVLLEVARRRGWDLERP